jgi:hypothetical protein
VIAGGDPMASGYSCALLEGGAVECWGYSGDGALGRGNEAGADMAPHPAPAPVTFP